MNVLFWNTVCAALLFTTIYAPPLDAAEKIRAAFLGIGAIQKGEQPLALLREHGFNTALVADSGLDVQTMRWKAWAQAAQRHDLRLLPIYAFAGVSEINAWRGTFSPYTTPGGTAFERTPCPLDAHYWERSVAERWETLAQLSRQTPFAGMLIDTEMYGGDLLAYQQPCICDTCWQEFAIAFALSNPAFAVRLSLFSVPAERRAQVLTEQQLWQQYGAIQEQRLQTLVTQIEQRIHAINPTLNLGFLLFSDNWFYRGLINGLGTPTQPVSVFSEAWYVRGFSSKVASEQAQVRRAGYAQYIPGVWQSRFFPADLPAQASQFAAQTDGYWIFSADSFWTIPPRSWHYALHDAPEEYWSAWNAANALIQEGQAAPIPPSSEYDEDAGFLRTPPALKTLLQGLSGASNAAPDILYERETLFHVFGQTDGAIRLMPVDAASVSYRLFDEAGTLRQTGSTTSALDIPVSGGMLSLLASPQSGGFRIDFGTMRWVVEASPTFPFATRSSPLTLHFAVTPDQTHIRFKVTTYMPQTSTATFTPPNGVERSVEFREYGEICAPIDGAAERAGFWTLNIAASSTESVRWHYFYQTPLPYLMP